MNRGILVSRGVPEQRDLICSAKGICASDKTAQGLMSNAIRRLTEGYFHIHG